MARRRRRLHRRGWPGTSGRQPGDRGRHVQRALCHYYFTAAARTLDRKHVKKAAWCSGPPRPTRHVPNTQRPPALWSRGTSGRQPGARGRHVQRATCKVANSAFCPGPGRGHEPPHHPLGAPAGTKTSAAREIALSETATVAMARSGKGRRVSLTKAAQKKGASVYSANGRTEPEP